MSRPFRVLRKRRSLRLLPPQSEFDNSMERVLRKKLSLYLANASTEAILLKPALGNIQTTISRFQQCEIVNMTADGDRMLQTYYEKLIVTYK